MDSLQLLLVLICSIPLSHCYYSLNIEQDIKNMESEVKKWQIICWKQLLNITHHITIKSNVRIIQKNTQELNELKTVLDKKKGMLKCLKHFRSSTICNNSGHFFMWAQLLARQMIDGKMV